MPLGCMNTTTVLDAVAGLSSSPSTTTVSPDPAYRSSFADASGNTILSGTRANRAVSSTTWFADSPMQGAGDTPPPRGSRPASPRT